MDKIIVEVGSTSVKSNICHGNKIEKLQGLTIEFKKHYMQNGSLDNNDIRELIEYILKLKSILPNIYVCGTSIFRVLDNNTKSNFLQIFKKYTNLEFHIVSQEEESLLTILGATQHVDTKACVMIGGGGSTEIAILTHDVQECVNSKLGVVDVMYEFPDLAGDFATTDLETVKEYIKERITLPQEKADLLILAGGGNEKFARFSGITYKKNNLYQDDNAPIMLDIELLKKEINRYYTSISLNNIRNNSTDPKWWYATRAMLAFVLVVAEKIDAKYIVPTDITMVYGIINKLNAENSSSYTL